MGKELQRIIINFLTTHKEYVAKYFVLSLATPIVNVVIPHYYGQILGMLKEHTERSDIIKTVVKIIVLGTIAQLLYMALDRLDSIFLPKLQSYVRLEFIEMIIQHSSVSYHELETGDLISKILKLPIIVKELFHQIRNFFLPTFMTVLFTIGYFTYLDIRLGSLTAILLCLFFTLFYFYSHQSVSMSTDTDTSHNILHEEIDDVLTNIASLHAASSNEFEIQRLRKIQNVYDDKFKNTILLSSRFKIIFNISYIIILFSIIGYSSKLYFDNTFTIENVTSILFVSIYLVQQLSIVSGELRDFIFNIGIINQINQYFHRLQKSTENTKLNYTIQDGSISIRNLNFQYNDKVLFRNFSCDIYPGQKIGIYGQIGSGKSTLIQLLLGLTLTKKDCIFIDNHSIDSMNKEYLRTQIGYIPQDTRLFNRTITENILYGTQKRKKDILDLLDQYSIRQIQPSMLDISCGKYGHKLSGGQRQIIHLLRCILKNTPIIILDEPTSNLDIHSKQDLIRILNRIDKTILIISHDPDLIDICDQLLPSNTFIQ